MVADSFNARVGYIAPGTIDLSGDGGQTELNLPWVSELAGDLIVAGNPDLTVIDMASLTTVAGSLSIGNNDAATAIDAGMRAVCSAPVARDPKHAPWFENNRLWWDGVVPIHEASQGYDRAGFLRGEKPLCPVEREELGPRVAGKRLQ